MLEYRATAQMVRPRAPARLGHLMAGSLAAVERFFERLFERPAARLFPGGLEPIQVQRGLERAIEAERRVHARRTYAPSSFRILLNGDDLSALDADRAAFSRQLGESVRTYARARGYVLLGRPSVEIEASVAVQPGDVRVYAAPVVVRAGTARRPARVAHEAAPPAPPVAAPEVSSSAAAALAVGHSTSVYAAAQPNAPHALLALRSPGLPVSRVPVRSGAIRIGRSADNDVVLADDRVSRHHGQIGVRLGMLVYTDLGSTNGSYLHGRAVTEIALGPGDVLQLGSSTVTIEPAT